MIPIGVPHVLVLVMMDSFQRFPTTQWTLVGRAGLEFNTSRREALDELLRRYWPALRTHLIVKRRFEPNDADDLVQAFIERKILERNLVSAADQTRGRFRTLLATALDNFVTNELQKRGAKKRTMDRAAALELDGCHDPASTADSPEQSFEITWAHELLTDVVERMRAECTRSDREDIWHVFEGRILAPTVGGREPVDYDQLVQQCGFASPSQASNVLVSAKRMFARLLRVAISEYAMDDDEIEDELRDLELVLSRSSRS